MHEQVQAKCIDLICTFSWFDAHTIEPDVSTMCPGIIEQYFVKLRFDEEYKKATIICERSTAASTAASFTSITAESVKRSGFTPE